MYFLDLFGIAKSCVEKNRHINSHWTENWTVGNTRTEQMCLSYLSPKQDKTKQNTGKRVYLAFK